MGHCYEIAPGTTYPTNDPSGFLYDQTAYFTGDEYHVQDAKNALAYRMSTGSRDNFIKFYTPCEKTRTVVDDEFSSSSQPTANEFAKENAELYDAAVKYYDAGCPYSTSMSVHLDRYNAENGTFITDCTEPLNRINLKGSLSPMPESMPKDWNGFYLDAYLIGNSRAFRYIKIAPDLAEKLVAAAGPSRTLTIDYVCRQTKFPIQDYVENHGNHSSNTSGKLILYRDTLILPSAIVTYKISGASEEVGKIAANITLAPYARTKSEQIFEQKVHMKIMERAGSSEDSRALYVFFPGGELRRTTERGYSMGAWYIIKDKLYIRVNSNPKELTGIPFEFAENGDLVLDGVHYNVKGKYDRELPEQWDRFSDTEPEKPAASQEGLAPVQAATTNPATPSSIDSGAKVDPAKPLPIDSIATAFAAAAASQRPLYGKSGKVSCSLEITLVQGDSFQGVYHDFTSGYPFAYTVEGKIFKDSASFTAVSWVQKPSIAPESDTAPGSGCSAEFKLGANGLCTGKVRYKTWERSALAINLSGEPIK